VEPALAVRGFVLGFTIAAAVGPISLLVIRRTLAEGRIVGLASGLGVATADGIYGAIAAFGLGAVTQVLVNARPVLGLVGGVFLLWLAWTTARATPHDPASAPPRRGGLAGAYLSILGLTLTNPMTILSFAALFAGLGIAGGDLVGSTSLTIGVLLGSGAWWLLLTSIVSVVRGRTTPAWIRRINVASGVLIGVFAVAAIASVVLG
jgi:threonine/homoserine/homoserine lactone efflux protein